MGNGGRPRSLHRLRRVRRRVPRREQHPDRRRRAGGARARQALAARRALLGGRVSRRAAEVPAGDVPAVRRRAVRAGVPDLRQPSHRRRAERAGLQPLHRHALLRQRLPVQRPLLRLLQPAVGQAAAPAAEPRRLGARGRRDGEVHVLRAAHQGGADRRPRPRSASCKDGEITAGLRAVVPGEGAGVRRPRTIRRARCRGCRDRRAARKLLEDLGTQPERHLSRRGRPRYEPRRPNQTHRRDDLLRPLLQTSWRFYVLVALLGGIVADGRRAPGSTRCTTASASPGINWPVYWAFYVTNFVFWIGISHAGTLISAILRLVNAGWRRPVTRCAEVDHRLRADDRRDVSDHPPRPAVAVLLAGAVPERAADLAELPLAAGLGLLRHHHLPHRQPAVPVPADDSRLRAGPRPRRPACGTGSTACSRSAGRARRSSGIASRSAMQIMAIAIIPVAVSVHTIVSFDFSMAPVPMWQSTIFGPYFVAGAIFSGIAGLIIAMALLRQVPAPRGVPAPGPLREPRQAAADDEPAVGLLRLRRAADGLVRQRARRRWRCSGETQRGAFAPLYWTMVVCNFVIPFMHPRRSSSFRTITGCVIASFGVLVGMWLERFLIIVPSLGHKYLPYTLGHLPAAAGRDHDHGRDVRGDGAALRAVREVRADHLDLGDEGGRASVAGADRRRRSDEHALGETHA